MPQQPARSTRRSRPPTVAELARATASLPSRTGQGQPAGLRHVPAAECALETCFKSIAEGKHGQGLFTGAPLQKRTVIGVYTGQLCGLVRDRTSNDPNAMRWPIRASFARHTLMASDDGNYKIVANPEIDVLSLVNEPSKRETANLWLKRVVVEVEGYRLLLTVYITAQDVDAGKELLVLYGERRDDSYKRDYMVGDPPLQSSDPTDPDVEEAFENFCQARRVNGTDIARTYGAVDETLEDLASQGLKVRGAGTVCGACVF